MHKKQILFYIIAFVTSNANSQQCFDSQKAFDDYCTTVLSGITDSGRCFFVYGAPSYPLGTWQDAWKFCASQNGTLAQIHSTTEMSKVKAYLKSILDPSTYGTNAIWIALARDPTVSTNTLTDTEIHNDHSFWCLNPTYHHPLLTAGNTWVRNSIQYDPVDDGADGYMLWYNDGGEVDRGVADYFEDNAYVTLCNFYNYGQIYTQSSKCITETPIETFQASHPQECVDACSTKTWCRSINYKQDSACTNTLCELFSWTTKDACPDCPNTIPTSDECYHYDYE